MKSLVVAIVIVGFFGTGLRAFAQMSSPSYEIRWDSIGAGGDDASSSPSYVLRDTVANTGAGSSSSAGYQLDAGYRAGIYDSFIDFMFLAQDNGSVESATGLAGTTISTTVDPFSSGDLVVLIQDRGFSQVSAIGKITSVGAGSITLDRLTDSGVVPVIDGTNDYVYRLSGASAALGTLDSSAVSTSVIGMEVTTDADAGYVVQIASDGDLRSGANTVDAVADGIVSSGSEEYGARSSDATLANSTFDSADTAILTTFQDVADAASSVWEDRSYLTLKGSISGSTATGSYSQAITLIVSGNY